MEQTPDAESDRAEPEVPAIGLCPGVRPVPALFVGPFGIYVDELKEFPPHGSGELGVRVYHAGVAEPLTAFWNDRGKFELTIKAITDANGRNLIANDSLNVYSVSAATPPYKNAGCLLKDLLRDTRQLRIQGEISVSLPVKIDTVYFDQLVPGTAASGKELRVELTHVSTPSEPVRSGNRVTMQLGGVDYRMIGDCPDRPLGIVLDEAGQPLRVVSASFSDRGNKNIPSDTQETDDPMVYSGSLAVERPPHALILKAFQEISTRDYPFE